VFPAIPPAQLSAQQIVSFYPGGAGGTVPLHKDRPPLRLTRGYGRLGGMPGGWGPPEAVEPGGGFTPQEGGGGADFACGKCRFFGFHLFYEFS